MVFFRAKIVRNVPRCVSQLHLVLVERDFVYVEGARCLVNVFEYVLEGVLNRMRIVVKIEVTSDDV